MKSVSTAIMQWVVFVLGLLSLLGGLVVFHFLGYHSDLGFKIGEGFGIAFSLVVGIIFILVAACNNETIGNVMEVLLFLLGLLLLLGNVGSALTAYYVYNKTATDGVIFVTVIFALIGLLITILCALGSSNSSSAQAKTPDALPPAQDELSNGPSDGEKLPDYYDGRSNNNSPA